MTVKKCLLEAINHIICGGHTLMWIVSAAKKIKVAQICFSEA